MRQRLGSSKRVAGDLLPPEGTSIRRIVWPYAIGVGAYHAIALLAALPWFFSWSGVALVLVGSYLFGTFGINIYYHRLLTHRGLTCAPWVGRVLAVLAICNLQDTPGRWVAVHRRHHEHADQQPDPHSPLVSLLWGHIGWMLVVNGDLSREDISRYAKDVLRDPFLRALEKIQFLIVVASWAVFLSCGFLIGAALGDTLGEAMQFALSVLVWGVFVRTVLVWHVTWSVNSLSHRWGYRNYDTGENSRNNVVVAMMSNGEGWHNNHHADPRAAKHGHRWWELDGAYATIWVMARLGLVQHVVLPDPIRIARRLTETDLNQNRASALRPRPGLQDARHPARRAQCLPGGAGPQCEDSQSRCLSRRPSARSAGWCCYLAPFFSSPSRSR